MKLEVFHICQKITQITYSEHAITICLILTNTFQNKNENNMNHTYLTSNEQAVIHNALL